MRALHAEKVVLGRWSVASIVLDSDLEPALIVDVDPTGVLNWSARERDFMAPEVLRGDSFVSFRQDCVTAGAS